MICNLRTNMLERNNSLHKSLRCLIKSLLCCRCSFTLGWQYLPYKSLIQISLMSFKKHFCCSIIIASKEHIIHIAIVQSNPKFIANYYEHSLWKPLDRDSRVCKHCGPLRLVKKWIFDCFSLFICIIYSVHHNIQVLHAIKKYYIRKILH